MHCWDIATGVWHIDGPHQQLRVLRRFPLRDLAAIGICKDNAFVAPH